MDPVWILLNKDYHSFFLWCGSYFYCQTFLFFVLLVSSVYSQAFFSCIYCGIVLSVTEQIYWHDHLVIGKNNIKSSKQMNFILRFFGGYRSHVFSPVVWMRENFCHLQILIPNRTAPCPLYVGLIFMPAWFLVYNDILFIFQPLSRYTFSLSTQHGSVSWGSRIHQLHLCRGVRHNKCPGYDKQSDARVLGNCFQVHSSSKW